MKDAISEITVEYYTLQERPQASGAQSSKRPDGTHLVHGEIVDFEGSDFTWLYGEFSECSATCGVGKARGEGYQRAAMGAGSNG